MKTASKAVISKSVKTGRAKTAAKAVKAAPKAAVKARAVRKAQPKRTRKAMLALLIAGHNEKLVIEKTLRSAIKAGMPKEHIYVVDDNSDDGTRAIAARVIGLKNTTRVQRSGKGLALTKAAKKFELTKRYQWIHIADADGGFAPGYFQTFREKLNPKFAAATGYVRSLPGESVSQYRVLEYTIGMEIHRRFQALANTVSVIPGPTSCFRSDVFDQVNFANKSLTEDFDVTIQIHRQKLGRVQFIPQAVVYTQDPRNLKDFTKQITRWNRGTMQGVRRHRIGFRPQKIDIYLSYQIVQNLMLAANYFGLLPYLAIRHHSVGVLAVTFLYDVAMMFILTSLVALKADRKDILSAFPQIYLYRWVTMYVFMKALFEVIILRKYRAAPGHWESRRYKSAMTV
ncbi:MAG TPA: glycosyltransferase family 2 protein [Candidatus Saccharimonadales bacterium]|nr:glycosyltransferase family 2 protein [Candidatus Saccharimonadales bacterium]